MKSNNRQINSENNSNNALLVFVRYQEPEKVKTRLAAEFGNEFACNTYRTFSDKKKCIYCNICTKVCHMGIDVMN